MILKPVSVASTNKIKSARNKVYLVKKDGKIAMRGDTESETTDESILNGNRYAY